MKLNTLVTLMVCAIIGSVLLVVFALYSVQITRATRDDVKDTALGIARTISVTSVLSFMGRLRVGRKGCKSLINTPR